MSSAGSAWNPAWWSNPTRVGELKKRGALKSWKPRWYGPQFFFLLSFFGLPIALRLRFGPAPALADAIEAGKAVAEKGESEEGDVSVKKPVVMRSDSFFVFRFVLQSDKLFYFKTKAVRACDGADMFFCLTSLVTGHDPLWSGRAQGHFCGGDQEGQSAVCV